MLELRKYQRDAIDALYDYWEGGGGNGLIVLPTGAGKALVIAKIIEELLSDYPDIRILNVTHSASLVKQNYLEFMGLLPGAPAGIYSASLNRRDRHAQVLFCGIQSIYKKADKIGDVDLVIVDEAHAISRNSNTQYGQFFKAIKERNPDSRVAGTTATDYRMDSGRLTEDVDDPEEDHVKMFDDVVFEVGIGELIDQGFLTKLTSRKTASKIDLKGVGSRGGEYVPSQVARAAERIIEDAISEDMVISDGCRAGLFFSASKENANHIASCIERHGRPCAVLTSDNAHQTEEIFNGFKSGKYWAISSVGMITTGTNFPFVDFISLILSTKSPGKLVQILGRGTRNSPGKEECLIADHGGNLAYHGPIDQISPKAPGKGNGEQPRKVCPLEEEDENGAFGCGELIPISAMKCHCCGYVFPPTDNIKITSEASDAPILSSTAPEPRQVTRRTFRFHEGKPGKKDSVKVTYMIGLTPIPEWVCPAHEGYAKNKADQFWKKHGGEEPCPETPMEWLERQAELKDTIEIKVRPKGRYWEVCGHTVSLDVPDAQPVNWSQELEDEIPF